MKFHRARPGSAFGHERGKKPQRALQGGDEQVTPVPRRQLYLNSEVCSLSILFA